MKNKIETSENTNKSKVKVNGYKSNKLAARRNKRAVEAEHRQIKYDDLSVARKIKRAKSHPGHSKRELKRLNSLAAK